MTFRRVAMLVVMTGAILVGGLSWAAGGLPWPIGDLRRFRIVSASPEPTLRYGDSIVVDVGDQEPVRGRLIAFQRGRETWISRVAGLPGDRIAMRGGLVSINGRMIGQRYIGIYHGLPRDTFGTGDPRLLVERFPGEAAPHAILDKGVQPQDDFAEVVVPAGHVFLLSDNRDNATDSRFNGDGINGGPGMVPLTGIVGAVRRVLWSNHAERRFKTIEQIQAMALTATSEGKPH